LLHRCLPHVPTASPPLDPATVRPTLGSGNYDTQYERVQPLVIRTTARRNPGRRRGTARCGNGGWADGKWRAPKCAGNRYRGSGALRPVEWAPHSTAATILKDDAF